MKNKFIKSYLIITATIVAVIFSIQGFCKEPKAVIGSTISDFGLKNVDGNIISLSDYKNAKGFIVVFTCNHCPFTKLYSKRLIDLNNKYSVLNVPLIAINSMDSLAYEDESFNKMKLKAKTDSFNFPYLHDDFQNVGKTFAAGHTPMAYIIWNENNQWIVKYKGSIDDNGENPEKATSFIGNAVDELLQNKSVSNPVTESFGCKIFYRK